MTSYTITYTTRNGATRTATVCGSDPYAAIATFDHMYPGTTTTGIRATHLPHTHGAHTPYAVPTPTHAIGRLARLVGLAMACVVGAVVLGMAAVWISTGVGNVPSHLPHGDTYQYHRTTTCPTEDSCNQFGQPVTP